MATLAHRSSLAGSPAGCFANQIVTKVSSLVASAETFAALRKARFGSLENPSLSKVLCKNSVTTFSLEDIIFQVQELILRGLHNNTRNLLAALQRGTRSLGQQFAPIGRNHISQLLVSITIIFIISILFIFIIFICDCRAARVQIEAGE